jgi:hypothetical protein
LARRLPLEAKAPAADIVKKIGGHCFAAIFSFKFFMISLEDSWLGFDFAVVADEDDAMDA